MEEEIDHLCWYVVYDAVLFTSMVPDSPKDASKEEWYRAGSMDEAYDILDILAFYVDPVERAKKCRDEEHLHIPTDEAIEDHLPDRFK